MIYKKDGETLDHVADNRLMSANSIPYTVDTIPTLVSGKRDNLLAVKDYSDYEVKHKTVYAIRFDKSGSSTWISTVDFIKLEGFTDGYNKQLYGIHIISEGQPDIPSNALNVTETICGGIYYGNSGLNAVSNVNTGLKYYSRQSPEVRIDAGYSVMRAIRSSENQLLYVDDTDISLKITNTIYHEGAYYIVTFDGYDYIEVTNGRLNLIKLEYDILTNN